MRSSLVRAPARRPTAARFLVAILHLTGFVVGLLLSSLRGERTYYTSTIHPRREPSCRTRPTRVYRAIITTVSLRRLKDTHGPNDCANLRHMPFDKHSRTGCLEIILGLMDFSVAFESTSIINHLYPYICNLGVWAAAQFWALVGGEW
jgi:hypothetical protein